MLAGGPQSHRVRAGCFVNSVKFVTSERDEGHVTQNNGVMVEGLGFNYYGVLVSVIELIYDMVCQSCCSSTNDSILTQPDEGVQF